MTGTKGGIEPTGIETPNGGKLMTGVWKVKRSGALFEVEVPSNSGTMVSTGSVKMGNEKKGALPSSRSDRSLSWPSRSLDGSIGCRVSFGVAGAKVFPLAGR